MKRHVVGVLLVITLIGGLLFIAVSNQVAEKSDISTREQKQATNPPDDVLAEKSDSDKGKVIAKTFRKTFESSEINHITQNFYRSNNQYVPSQYSVNHYTVTYNTTDEKNRILVNTAQIYVPNIENAQELPIYVFGSGTTGIDDQCAPSKEVVENDNWGDYRAHMLSYAGQGYIVVFPDYEGFNDGPSRIHHYFHSQLEAQVMLDAARAAYNFFSAETSTIQPSEHIFFAGYSQGGHAAFAAKDKAQEYAPELPIKGVIGYGSTNNLRNLLRENPQLSPYLFVAFNDLHSDSVVAYDELLLPRWLPTLESDVKSKCITAVSKYFPLNQKDIYTPEFIEALENNTPGEFADLFTILEENSTGYTRSDIPAMIVQGGIDPIVSNESTEEFIKKSCSAGNVITYKLYPGVHHYQTRQVSFKDSLEWMKERIEGTPAKNDC